MNKKYQAKRFAKKATALATVFGMAASLIPAVPMQVKAEDFAGTLTEVKAVEVDKTDKNIVWVTFNGDIKGKLTFLDDGIFRYNVDPSGEFAKYATPRQGTHVGRIQQYPDESENYSHPEAAVTEADGNITITSGGVSVVFDKDTALMSIKKGNKTVMEEKEPLILEEGRNVQTLKKRDGENFYGGGMQNGRFVHTGESINIVNEGKWVDGNVTSPNPFYYTTDGYGVLRNTFHDGFYNFGKAEADTVEAVHDSESEFDAYYFVAKSDDGRKVTQEILQEFYKVTGNPVLLPEYAYYVGHLNAYNRDSWSDESGSKAWTVKGTDPADSEGTTTYESGMAAGYVLEPGMHSESLNGEGPKAETKGTFPDNVDTPYEYSARKVIDNYLAYDMPLGFFLPNDGYGAGYGQNGYYQTGGVNQDGSSSPERIAAVDANVGNLKDFADYAASKGVATGLWTQSYLVPDSNPNTEWHLLRDFRKEVGAGVTTLKTDVAWVGDGYSMQLDGVKTAYDVATSVVNTRPNIISLCGWAGSHRYNGIWSGDQTGGNWEYIRFHIPTFIGCSLSGNPNVGSDMDGIFGGDAVLATRDYQWKTFTQLMLNMDGWGSYVKAPYTFGDPYTGISRMYLKLKSTLMPYLYTSAYAASNIDTGNDDTGLPMIRAMHLEYPEDDYAYSKEMQYQYMFGGSVLVAPIYQNTAADENGNDIRNRIYLPDPDQIWVDFLTGEQYRGGQILNNYDAPLWKLPAFVKNGAIIPQYEANNSAYQIKKENRIVEFWPEGETAYTAVEDDGSYLKNDMTPDDDYGVIDNISYGPHVSTRYTSKVEGTKATLTAEKSTGAYNGYKKDKNTTFVVHVSKEPTGIVAKNGDSALTAEKAASKETFDQAVPEAGKAVWFYDAAPAIETYASEKETAFKEMVANVKVAPKLYVKFAQADAQAAAQTLVIEGFENDGKLSANQENSELSVPDMTEDVEAKTPTSIKVDWEKVEGATSYELMLDGKVNIVGDVSSFTYADLKYDTYYTFQIRSRNADGYSAWSEEQRFKTDLDPWRNTPDPVDIQWTGQIWGAHTPDLAFDKVFQEGSDGFHSNYGGVNELLTVDYGKIYNVEKIEYYPRTDGGDGSVKKMRLEISLDGKHWKKVGEFSWEIGTGIDAKIMEVNQAVRFARFTALESVSVFFAASEIKMCTVEGDKGVATGSTNGNTEVTEGDYTNMKNYLGTSVKDGSNFTDQIQKRHGDLNDNGYYDVYDYSYTMFQLNGGTQQNQKLSGASFVSTSKQNVEAGDTFTVTYDVKSASGVNALGQILPYDPNKVELVSVKASDAIKQMENLCVNKVYEDGTAYVNIAYANKGNQELYKGTDSLVTVTMKAKEDISTDDSEVLELHGLILIGADYTTNGEILEDPVALTKQFGRSDFNITMTNEKLPTDDGTNVARLIQWAKDYAHLGYGYDMLFNGKYDREFEFLWDNEDNYVDGKLPDYVTLPVTMHFALEEPEEMGKFVVYNSSKGNGFATVASARANYTDGTYKEEEIALTEAQQVNNAAFTFKDAFVPNKKVKSVDITIKKAIDASGADTTNMLTLAEVAAFGREFTSEEEQAAVLFKTDEFTVAMTNAELTSDDGTNVERLIQQKKYDGLFNGNKTGREFEFLWDNEDNWDETGSLPSYVTLPLTLHFTLEHKEPVSNLIVHNANKGNGFVTKATARVNYADGTSAEKTIELASEEQVDYAPFVFKDLFNEKEKAVSVDVTLQKAITSAGRETLKMLTLSEIELFKGDASYEDAMNILKDTAVKASEASKEAQKAAEAAQQLAEAAREEAEAAESRAAEAERKSVAAQEAAEAAKRDAQTAAAAAGQDKDAAEQAAQRAQTAQQAADQAKRDAETAKSDAEISLRAAETARLRAESAKGEAEVAKTAAETARRLAEEHAEDANAAKAEAEAAKKRAEAARDEAEAARNDVETAKAEAEASRLKASIAADSAASQAELAKTLADSAKLYAQRAEAARDRAEEAAKKVEEALRAAEELVKKAQADADAKIAKMQAMFEKERFSSKKVSLKSVKGQAGKIKLTWKTVSKANGYEISYSVNSSMKGQKKVTVKGGSKITKTLAKLKSNKNYYVRVRAYKKIGDQKVYTKYSAKKKVHVN